MAVITIDMHITVPEKEHLEVSSFVKTMMQAMDLAIENRNKLNDCMFKIEGVHPDAVTMQPPERHPLRDPFGL